MLTQWNPLDSAFTNNSVYILIYVLPHGWIERGAGRGYGHPLGISQVAIAFLRSAGIDRHEKQLDPFGSIAFQGRFIWPSVKYVDV